MSRRLVPLPSEINPGARLGRLRVELGEDGRKLYAGTALFAETGELLALARQTWIVPRSS